MSLAGLTVGLGSRTGLAALRAGGTLCHVAPVGPDTHHRARVSGEQGQGEGDEAREEARGR